MNKKLIPIIYGTICAYNLIELVNIRNIEKEKCKKILRENGYLIDNINGEHILKEGLDYGRVDDLLEIIKTYVPILNLMLLKDILTKNEEEKYSKASKNILKMEVINSLETRELILKKS